ncbi:MAG: hypothetical protein COA76_04505 [Moritella sp.]|nr:MAG: hypothetical protein COA76_04505 [Moritella sp.]
MNNLITALDTAPLEISRHLVKKSYLRGSHIIQPAVNNDYLFFLIKGEVEVKQFTYEGNEILLKELTAFDIFGELEIFDQVFKTNAVVAVADCQVTKLRRDYVFEWMKIDHNFSKCLFDVIVNRYVQTCSRTDNLATLTIKQRLLLNIFKHYEKGDLHAVQKNRLIQEVGAPKISLNRVLKECIDEGYVKYSEKQFSINDMIKLESFIAELL